MAARACTCPCPDFGQAWCGGITCVRVHPYSHYPAGDLFMADAGGTTLQRRTAGSGTTVAGSWALPSGGCSDLALSAGGQLAAVCGPSQQVFLLDTSAGVPRFKR